MRESFVKYLEKKNLFPSVEIENNNHPTLQCDAKIIENLSGYKIGSLVKLDAKRETKVIEILEGHLKAQHEKASTGSYQYNSNQHIGLVQALAMMRSKKTQP